MHMHTGAFAATDMNDHSSRSHVIFTITVERSDLGPDHQQHVHMGKLHLVDLAVRVGEKGGGREEGWGGKERKDAAMYVCNVRLQAMVLAQSRVAISACMGSYSVLTSFPDPLQYLNWE